MVIIGENLIQLMEQHKMVDRPNCFDETCIQLSLGDTYISLCPDSDNEILTYGEPIPEKYISRDKINEDGLVLSPKTAVLAASAESVFMPEGYMGLLQTKGSLARLFVSLHFSDGQIDPGFRGKVTFEIFNASDFKVRLRRLQPVGNLYVFKTSTKKHKLYCGKYAEANGPTIQLPFR